MAEHCNKMPREAVESPSLVALKTQLDVFLCDLHYVIFRGPLQPSSILWDNKVVDLFLTELISYYSINCGLILQLQLQNREVREPGISEHSQLDLGHPIYTNMAPF